MLYYFNNEKIVLDIGGITVKEQLYTIPLMDAFKADDECPFCFIERNLEQYSINFVLGSGASYMEDDIRSKTDKLGFCRTHYKKLYDYGNRLGCGLILSTHIKQKNKELEKKLQSYKPTKISMLNRFKKASAPDLNSINQWIKEQTKSCYICEHSKETYRRYLDTFFDLYKKESAFKEMIKESKGFCLVHFGDLMEQADQTLSEKDRSEFYHLVFPLMLKHMQRVQKDIEWFCDKFDYRNKDADWKNSKDAIQRTMQKMVGGYPADPPFVQDK